MTEQTPGYDKVYSEALKQAQAESAAKTAAFAQACTNLASVLAAYFKALLAAGFGREEALLLVTKLQSETMAKTTL